MPEYSKEDLKYAAEFREEIHREALAIVRKTRPLVTDVIDRHPVEDYFQESWEYPGKWYTVVAIPYGYKSRDALVDQIVRDTLSRNASGEEPTYTQELRNKAQEKSGRKKLSAQLSSKPAGYEELFTAERKNGSFCAVGADAEGRYILERCEEYKVGGDTCSKIDYYVISDSEYGLYARQALLHGQLKQEEYFRLTAGSKAQDQDDDPFYTLISEYPDLVVDYCIVKCKLYLGYESHLKALKTAFSRLCKGWEGDPARAVGKKITAKEQFSSNYPEGKLNYRKAFLYPPQRTGYTGDDFARVNAALFPDGTERLEAYEWDTDWSEYFDEGHEWWGALCLTIFDRPLGRFVVIMASATD